MFRRDRIDAIERRDRTTRSNTLNEATEAIEANDAIEAIEANDAIETNDAIEAIEANDAIETNDAIEAIEAIKDGVHVIYVVVADQVHVTKFSNSTKRKLPSTWRHVRQFFQIWTDLYHRVSTVQNWHQIASN